MIIFQKCLLACLFLSVLNYVSIACIVSWTFRGLLSTCNSELHDFRRKFDVKVAVFTFFLSMQ